MSAGPEFLFRSSRRDASDSEALAYLEKTVNRLIRAERRQSLVHYGCAGLFWGLILAAGLVLILQMGLISLPVTYLIPVCIIVALAISFGARWATRRSPLAITIVGDMHLGLKQQLSSAWELYEQNSQCTTAASISRLLPRIRTSDADRVFPLTGNNANPIDTGVRWGRLIPAAALLLALLSTLNISQHIRLPGKVTANDAGIETDIAVQREGESLRNFAESFEIQARNNDLEASARFANTMLNLGRHMEAGVVTRETSLKQLNDLRRSINDDRRRLASAHFTSARQTLADNTGGATSNSTSQAKATTQEKARDIIENAVRSLTNGEMSPAQLHDDSSLQQALMTADINPNAFHKALEDAYDGDPESLEKILLELSADERNAKDAQALERASTRIQSIRENLGAAAEPNSPSRAGNSRNSELYDNSAPGRDLFDQPPGATDKSSSFVFGNQGRAGSQHSASETAGNPVPATSVAVEDQPQIQAKGKLTDGRELNTTTRKTARENRIKIPLQITTAEQHRQLEAILSKETLPAHQKNYIKQYFLELSRATSAASPAHSVEPTE